MFGLSGSNLQRILSDSCADVDSNSSDFWVMVAALKVSPSICSHNELTSKSKYLCSTFG